MSPSKADPNRLFASLALQLHFVSPDVLRQAINTWNTDKNQTIGQILLAQFAITPHRLALLNALVAEQLQIPNHTPEDLPVLNLPDTLIPTPAQNLTPPATSQYETQIPNEDRYQTVAPTDSPHDYSPNLPTPVSNRFQVIRAHARGGLGEVLVAMDRELHREVALKQMQDHHADNIESRLRFLLEAEITGGLEHPGIVPVYGLGMYEDGRPYYAMRLIRGDSFKDAIDRFHKSYPTLQPGDRVLGLRGLLRRFVDVCYAIDYAHARGVIHRDIKPANVMLGNYGETLVVDWGLAKPVDRPSCLSSAPEGTLSPPSASISMPTLMGATIGTPQFMSPEQAIGRVDVVGHTSDIYSLGATLYNLLSGRQAFDGHDIKSILDKVVLGQFSKPRQWMPSLSPPLEAICLKAMALEPAMRYASARALANDIEHWLADEPVTAWREPWPVRLRRWVKRHKTLVTTAGTALLLVTTGLAITTVLLNAANSRERTARTLAEQNELEAQTQRTIAEHNYQLARESVDRYHTNVSENLLLNEPGFEPLRRKLLNDARDFYATFVKQHQDDPEVAAELGNALFRLAQITGEIDSPQKAIELHQQALTLMTSLAAQQPGIAQRQAAVARCNHHLGRLYRLLDKVEQAKAYGEKAVTLWEELLRDHPAALSYEADYARSLNVVANVYQVLRSVDQAVVADEKAQAIWLRLSQADPANADFQRYLALSSNHLGMVYNDLNQVKKSEDAFRDALRLRKQLADRYPNVSLYQHDLATTHYNLGDLFAQSGQLEKAEEPFQRATVLWKDLHTKQPAVSRYQTNLAEAYSGLTRLHLRKKSNIKAAQFAEQALETNKLLAARFPEVPIHQSGLAESYSLVATVHLVKEENEQAETAFKEAIEIQHKLVRQYGKVPIYQADLGRSYHNLGKCYQARKDSIAAEAAFHSAHRLWENLATTYPKEVEYALELRLCCYYLGNNHFDQHRFTDAVLWYDRAAAALLNRFPDKTLTPAMRLGLGNTFRQRAEANTKLKQFKVAITDWDRAISYTTTINKPWFELERSRTVALSGDHTTAEVWATKVDLNKVPIAEFYFRLASLHGLMAAVGSKDTSLTVEQRTQLTQRNTARALEYLETARKSTYFAIPANLARLKAEPDLESVRALPGYQLLLKAIEKKVSP